MAIKVFADGANLEGMLDMYENGNVQGFTTNPSLMKAGGVTDYRAFAKTVLEHITDVSVVLASKGGDIIGQCIAVFMYLARLDGHFLQGYDLFLHHNSQRFLGGWIVNVPFLEAKH